MKQFLDHNFLLSNPTAERLYHEFAAPMPIIDYHNHLPPAQIASNINFDNITQAWLYGDHYKWRAMRTNGVDEKYCTGNASDFEKFGQWAATVPYTMRNPLYHWTHLELQRYFGVTTLLNSDTAAGIYDHCSAQLQQASHTIHGLLQLFNVKIICTTDDPVDDLAHHQQISRNNRGIKVFPAFRPDKAMDVADATAFNQYLGRLEAAANISISNFNDYITALRQRHDYFAANGCCVSDHGLEQIIPVPYTIEEVTVAFARIRGGQSLSADEQLRFRSCMLEFFAEWDWEKGWVQQYHLGALRNTNSRMLRLLGPDTGWDSIGDFSQASGLAAFLNRLDNQNKLAKTIVYNLNPADNELMATMTGNFNDGSVAAKVQLGAAWWFLDQKDGITRQINALSNMGLLSRSVGMLTDSRSFLSFPRHEYFRRLLCNLLGEEVMQGELPNDIDWLGKMVQDICYHNVYHYFNWKQ